MSYGYYEINTPEGKPMKRGYSVECQCHKRGCKEQIDRGLSYLCYNCTQYFCGRHLTYIYDRNDEPVSFECFAGEDSQICEKCEQRMLRDKDFQEDYLTVDDAGQSALRTTESKKEDVPLEKA